MQIGSLELSVMVADRPVREWGHQGRTYIEGRKGSKFTLRFRNNNAQRILAVPSIDGLCAVDGQPATGASKGYIIAAYSSTEIKGWKLNLRETADFVFTDKEKTSYAAQTAGAQNCGLIAMKVFAEKFNPPAIPQTILYTWSPPYIVREIHHYPNQPYWPGWPHHVYCGATGQTESGSNNVPQFTCGMAANIGASAAESGGSLCNAPLPTLSTPVTVNMVQVAETPDFTLGTGFGQVREDVVCEASFDRGPELATFEIFYSDEAALIAAGVLLSKSAQISKPIPQGFGGFCRPPDISA